MGLSLAMPPSQYDNLMRRLDEMSKQIVDLNKALHDHASLEAEDREALAEKINHAFYGGNGDGPGIFERFRNIFDWRAEHLKTHEHAGQERRTSSQDWRRFWIGVADRTFTIIFAVIASLIIYFSTGHVISFP
jgi:hypothetical protein